MPTNTVTIDTLDAGTPESAKLRTVAKYLVAIVPIVIAFVHPSLALSGDVEVGMVLAGLALFAVIHVVELIVKNGLTKAGLRKTVTEEEAWVHDNSSNLQAMFADAQDLVSNVPGGPAALGKVVADYSTIRDRFNALPAAQKSAAEDAVNGVVDRLHITLGDTQIPVQVTPTDDTLATTAVSGAGGGGDTPPPSPAPMSAPPATPMGTPSA